MTSVSEARIPGAKEAPSSRSSVMDTLLVTPEVMEKWHAPFFQRKPRPNAKVKKYAEEIKGNGGVMSGIITLGYLRDKPHIKYVLDGIQRRYAACYMAGLPEYLVDVRVMAFDTMAEMGIEFVRLQEHLVAFRADDKLHGYEGVYPIMATIRKQCPFVGYANVRRGTSKIILGMSTTLRCWYASGGDAPNSASGGITTEGLAEKLSETEAAMLIRFLNIAYTAWGDDHSNIKMWSALNLTLCMWLFRRLLVDYKLMYQDASRRYYTTVNADQFKKALMSLSADANYAEWLIGRTMSDRDRGPAYARIKKIFVSRLGMEGVSNTRLPSPEWTR